MYFVLTRGEQDFKEPFGGAWGYYWDLDTAIEAVHRNVTDMHETIYPYAIIARLDHGLFPAPKERYWFGWEKGREGFYEIEKPECANIVPDNFSLALGVMGDPDSIYTEATPETIDNKCQNYFISAVSSDDLERENVRRCGFFKDRETAFRAVRENLGNIYNDKYDFVYIELITPYIMAWCLERVWFQWDEEKREYIESKAPEGVDWPDPPYYPISLL